MNKDNLLFEGCIETIAEANYYKSIGIDRLELCSELQLGGICPRYELVDYCINVLNINSVVMLKLRDDFSFLPSDLLIYKHYIEQTRKIGARNFIFGFTLHGKIDVIACKQIIALLDGCDYAFHMAIDSVFNYDVAIRTVIDLGFKWVLTGGGNQRPAIQNTQTLKNAIDKYGDKINFLIGRKVDASNWQDIAMQTGAIWFHGRKIK